MHPTIIAPNLLTILGFVLPISGPHFSHTPDSAPAKNISGQ